MRLGITLQYAFTIALLQHSVITSTLALFFDYSDQMSSDVYASKYRYFLEDQRLEYREKVREMFTFGFDSYMRHAFPLDELDPIHCSGRGPDYDNPHNININDVLGDYCLTLVDTLDSLVVLGNTSEFQRAVQLVIDYVSFDKDNTVQVFEATIRVLGGLLSAHQIITDPLQRLGNFSIGTYNNELLHLANDLAARLLPAFEGTSTGIPFPRVNLMYGVAWDTINETCTAGAGSLLLEFGILSRLLGDPTYEGLARRTNKALWRHRDPKTGLLGNLINIQTGDWVGVLSGLGASLDSFFEYLLKAYILFGNQEDYEMFNQSYSAIKEHLRKGRTRCTHGHGDPPLYINVHMRDGSLINTWIDSLQAAFPGVQVLNGDIDEAICAHALYYAIWKRYGALPERFNWKLKAPDVSVYPLRPEFAESTYLLYMATKSPFYLHVGREIVDSLNTKSRTKCGFATLHNVEDKSLEDRMESFFLSETLKYLFLLFDKENPVNKHYSDYIFTTEGHLFAVDAVLRQDHFAHAHNEEVPYAHLFGSNTNSHGLQPPCATNSGATITAAANARNASIQGHGQCEVVDQLTRFKLPLESRYIRQMESFVGGSLLPPAAAVEFDFCSA